MNNYTERTWAMVTMSEAVKNLMATYLEHPRKLQSQVYTGPITISQYERFQNVREMLGKEGITLPMPTGKLTQSGSNRVTAQARTSQARRV